ncbi:MAG TPA: ABC transporter permease, partial [Bradyrhizobium sp.]
LLERKATTLMTALGIALTVGVLVTSMALINGLRSTFSATGNPLQVIVLRKGVSAELSSSVTEDALQQIKLLSGIARRPASAGATGDEPMASPELISIINLPSVDNPAGMNVTVRGLLPIGMSMRAVRLTAGRWFVQGRRELVVGESVARRYKAAFIGNHLRFGRGDWLVVGIFSGGRSAINSEIWCDLNQLRPDFDRQGEMSSVLVRAQSPAEVNQIIAAVKDDRLLGATAKTEASYYADMTNSGLPLQVIGTFVAGVMAVGSAFGAMNTMYAAVARRGREIATLRALGFSRRSILSSFLLESIALSLIGGLIGCLLALPLNSVTTGVGNFATFSEIAFNFRVGPSTVAAGLIFAAVIGAIGGFLPARAAARRDLLTALREA